MARARGCVQRVLSFCAQAPKDGAAAAPAPATGATAGIQKAATQQRLRQQASADDDMDDANWAPPTGQSGCVQRSGSGACACAVSTPE